MFRVILCLVATSGLWAFLYALADDFGPETRELDPDQVVQGIADRLKAFEGKDPLLQGIKEAKPSFERENGKMKTAAIVFSAHAIPPGKGPAKPKTEGKPFFYFSAHLWSGKSDQPPANTRHFRWKGESYTSWVQVYGSDKKLVEAVRQGVDEPILAPR